VRLLRLLNLKLAGLWRFIVEHKKLLAVAAGLFASGLGLRVWCEAIGYGGLGVWGIDLTSRCLYMAALVTLTSFLLSKRLVVLCAVLGFATIFLNGIVMGANNGYMPAIEGIRELPYRQYILATDATHLNWLGDWISGSILGRKFATSPGDMFSAVLILVLLFEFGKGGIVRFRGFIKRRRGNEITEITKVS